MLFASLKQEINQLKRALVPEIPLYDGTYVLSDDEERRVVAYSVLAHAEMEHFCKIKAGDLCSSGVSAFRLHNRLNRVVVALCIAYQGGSPPVIDRRLKNRGRSRSLDLWLGENFVTPRLDAALVSYRSKVELCYGIREHNLRTFLTPLGYRIERLDNLWIQEIDKFGRTRGDRAHQARSLCPVKKGIDARSEVRTVSFLMKGLLSFSNTVDAEIRSHRP